MFEPGARVAFLHAHPDDETLSTGALIAGLIADGHPVAVVTATRGERGEARPPLDVLTREQFVVQRECELRRALEDLGVTERAWLGTAPARAAGMPTRRYRDSGMRWDGDQAVPSGDAGPDALTSAGLAEPAADLAAFLEYFRADVVVSYDGFGGYGHPDHVACHHIARLAAGRARFAEIVSPTRPGGTVLDRPDQVTRLQRALADYPSQFEVVDNRVRHVGGQHQPIETACRLRWCDC